MDLLTVDETAAMLRVNPVTIRRYIKSGRLPAVRVGRQVRIEKEAAEALATPIVPLEHPISVDEYVRRKPSPEELEQRKALIDRILENRERRNIAPLTASDLIPMAREEERSVTAAADLYVVDASAAGEGGRPSGHPFSL